MSETSEWKIVKLNVRKERGESKRDRTIYDKRYCTLREEVFKL